MATDSVGELRRCALGVAVLHGVDLEPAAAGLRLTGAAGLLIGWPEVVAALGEAAPQGRDARHRLAAHLRARLALAAGRPVRPYAVPVDSATHPGPGWTRFRVLGGALEVGLGVAGLDPSRPECLAPLPPAAAAGAGLDAAAAWVPARRYLAEMGALAVARLGRDPDAPLRPMGDCDVLTLLAEPRLRATLAAGAGGLRTAAVPMRERGWLDLRRIDPTFAAAAAAATEPERRGFSRPVLLTADEVVLAPPVSAARFALAGAG